MGRCMCAGGRPVAVCFPRPPPGLLPPLPIKAPCLPAVPPRQSLQWATRDGGPPPWLPAARRQQRTSTRRWSGRCCHALGLVVQVAKEKGDC